MRVVVDVQTVQNYILCLRLRLSCVLFPYVCNLLTGTFTRSRRRRRTYRTGTKTTLLQYGTLFFNLKIQQRLLSASTCTCMYVRLRSIFSWQIYRQRTRYHTYKVSSYAQRTAYVLVPRPARRPSAPGPGVHHHI